MNSTQRRYVCKRIDEIAGIRLHDVYTYSEKLKSQAIKKIVEKIRNKEIKLISAEDIIEHISNKIDRSCGIHSSIDMNIYLLFPDLRELSYNITSLVDTNIHQQIKLMAARLKDQVMLGDCEEALEKIQEFMEMSIESFDTTGE